MDQGTKMDTPTRPRDPQQKGPNPLAQDINGRFVATPASAAGTGSANNTTTPLPQFISQSSMSPITPAPKVKKATTTPKTASAKKIPPPPLSSPHQALVEMGKEEMMAATTPVKTESIAEMKIKKQKREKKPTLKQMELDKLEAGGEGNMDVDVTTADQEDLPAGQVPRRSATPQRESKAQGEPQFLLPSFFFFFFFLLFFLSSSFSLFCSVLFLLSSFFELDSISDKMIFKEFLVVIEGIFEGVGGKMREESWGLSFFAPLSFFISLSCFLPFGLIPLLALLDQAKLAKFQLLLEDLLLESGGTATEQYYFVNERLKLEVLPGLQSDLTALGKRILEVSKETMASFHRVLFAELDHYKENDVSLEKVFESLHYFLSSACDGDHEDFYLHNRKLPLEFLLERRCRRSLRRPKVP
jgi:hypothetical protein